MSPAMTLAVSTDFVPLGGRLMAPLRLMESISNQTGSGTVHSGSGAQLAGQHCNRFESRIINRGRFGHHFGYNHEGGKVMRPWSRPQTKQIDLIQIDPCFFFMLLAGSVRFSFWSVHLLQNRYSLCYVFTLSTTSCEA